MNKTQNYNDSIVPMFLPTQMEQPMATNDQTQKNMPAELSVFDVKELYDMAYMHEKNDIAKFKTLLAEAVKLDIQYRRQLTQKAVYKPHTEQKTFNAAGGNKKSA